MLESPSSSVSILLEPQSIELPGPRLPRLDVGILFVLSFKSICVNSRDFAFEHMT